MPSLYCAEYSYSLYIVFCLAKPPKPNPPKVVSVTHSSVTLSVSPPAGASAYKVIMYTINYRKYGRETVWKTTSESGNLSQTVTDLDATTLYEFKVVVKYEGETATTESKTVQAKTKEGKCMVPMDFGDGYALSLESCA